MNIGPLNLQPSELLKIFIVIFFAAYLSENRDVLTEGSLRFGQLGVGVAQPAVQRFLVLLQG